MSHPVRRAVGVTAVAASVALGIGAVLLSDPAEAGVNAVLFLAFLASPLMGALLIVRVPGNVIGWLFACMGCVFPGAMFVYGYASSAVRAGWPGLLESAWLAQWLYLAFIVPTAVLFAVFPSGRLPRGWLRLLVVVVGVTAVLVGIAQAFGPPSFDIAGTAVPNAYRLPDHLAPALTAAGEVANVVLTGSATVVAVVLVARLRRARGIERQQLKWFVGAAALIGLVLPLGSLLPPELADMAWILAMVGFGSGLPVAAAIAILRYRLYDIDVVIRRTLVYALVVGVLAAVYVALVVGFQALLVSVTGGETLPVALSTLAIAALFRPVRSRVGDIVDRRFYRSRYRADRTLAAFAVQLRDEVELDSVGGLLVEAAVQTVRPASARLWLRVQAAR